MPTFKGSRRLVSRRWEGVNAASSYTVFRVHSSARVDCPFSIVAAPTIQSMLVAANLGPISNIAGAAAGPFTVHFWAPMSKWGISGASFMDLNRPTDKVSLPQYSALTATGFFFSRYALLVTPINPTLCSVNVALFLSSGWHLGRKIKADYF